MAKKWMIAGLVLVLLGTLMPAGVLAQDEPDVITVSLWNGDGTVWWYYQIDQSDAVRLYYYWFAETEAQVQAFVDNATIEITLNDEPLFGSEAESQQNWGSIQAFVLQGYELLRAEWSFVLPPLETGAYTVHTVIRLNQVVEDGMNPTPFQPGVLHDTTNVLLVGEMDAAAVPVPGAAADVTADPADTVAAPETAPEAQPQPEEIHSDPVVGTFVATSEAYYEPQAGKLAEPYTEFSPGMSLWVFGMDRARHYYYVLLDDVYLWVRAETIAPTNDSVWANNPLPNVIIE